MRDRHALRPPRAAAGVKHQSRILRRRRRSFFASRSSFDAHKALVVRGHRVDGNSASRRSLLRGVAAPAGVHQQHFRVGVFQIKVDFLLAITGIQRRGCACDRRSQKTDDHRQAIRAISGDAIALLNAKRSQGVGHGRHLIAKLLIRDADSRLGEKDCRAFRGRGLDQLQ